MKKNRFVLTAVLGLLIIGGCEDQSLTKSPSTQSGVTTLRGDSEGPGSYTDHPNGDTYAYPKITFKEFIPEDDLYDWKTLTWRIEWPEYGPGADPDKIPTLFSLNGALNSFHYLNNADPENTYNTLFSLYHDNKLTRPTNLSAELDFFAVAQQRSMNEAWFLHEDWEIPVDEIQRLVEDSPGGFQWSYDEDMTDELPYNAGDFFYVMVDRPGTPTLWGGIRIISMTPRIIEVYVAVHQ